MKTVVRLLALSLIAASCSAAELFVRPTLGYVIPSAKNYSDAAAVGVAGGIFLGAQREHELSLDLAVTRWDVKAGPGSSSRIDGDENYVPLLANYKFHTSGDDDLKNVKFYIGPCAGLVYEKLNITSSGPFFRSSTDESDTVFAYGGSAGFVIKVARRIDLDLGYRYLHLEKPSYAATQGLGNNSSTQIISAGVCFRF